LLPIAGPFQNHGIVEWVGLEGTFKGHPVQPPAMSRNIFNQIRLLRAPSNLTWNVSRDGASPPLRATYAGVSPPSS